MLRMQGLAFGPPSAAAAPVQASCAPMFAHLALVLLAGVWLPAPLVAWFQSVAARLG
jgi:hydrogenase-4 component F